MREHVKITALRHRRSITCLDDDHAGNGRALHHDSGGRCRLHDHTLIRVDPQLVNRSGRLRTRRRSMPACGREQSPADMPATVGSRCVAVIESWRLNGSNRWPN